MSKRIDQIKLEQFDNKTQVVLFKRNGELVESCNTLIRLKQELPVFQQFNFLLGIQEIIEALNEPLNFDLVEWDEQVKALFSMKFEPTNDDFIQWFILDKTQERDQILSVQQARNNASINEELLAIREKYLETEKQLLALKNSELQRVQKFKERFFAEVSHEMRTPLNSIAGIVKLLEHSQPDEHYNYLHALKSTSEHLNHIINDVLDISKIEEGKLSLETLGFDLREILSAIIHGFTVTAQEKKIEIDSSVDEKIPKIIETDPIRLSQILYNLIGNAIKFTHQGGIKVSIDFLTKKENQISIKISVQDTGIGMSQESIQKILEPYAQVEGQSYFQYGGTGLGMGIAHRLIQVFGGHLSIESTKGVGTNMSFELNVVEGSEVQYSTDDHYDASTLVDINKFKFLFAEDDEMSTLIMRERANTWNLDAVFVHDVQSLENELWKNPYDILISDLNLDQNAITTIIKLRQSSNVNATIPILFISGDSKDLYPELNTIEDWEYMVKPVNPRALLLKVRQMLELSSNQQQMEALDLSALKTSVQNDTAFLVELIDTILENLPEDLHRFTESIKSGNSELARKALHKMKPSISYLGMPSLMNERNEIYDRIVGRKDITEKSVQVFQTKVNLALEKLAQEKSILSK